MTKIGHTRFLLAVSAILLFSVAANANAAPSQTAVEPVAAPAIVGRYVNAMAYLPSPDRGAWYRTTRRLKRNFDDICGDTFCSGEFTNIEALRYNCSVDRTTGQIAMCAWTFAASEEAVDPFSGDIVVDKGFWRCRTPLAPNTTIGQLITALAGDAPLHARLPGTYRTIMDGLIDDCFF